MNAQLSQIQELVPQAFEALREWQARWPAFAPHGSVATEPRVLRAAWSSYIAKLQAHSPLFHPYYAGQMVKPPHPVAALGYLAAMLINPNGYDSVPVADMEREAIAEIAAMFRLPRETLGHLTTGGAMANFEALWISRELRPGKEIAFSEQSHFTHRRACSLLGVRGVPVAADDQGRMDLNRLEALLRTREIGTVVVTAGTTGFGAVDPIHEVVRLRERYGFRVHVDAAYGGFYSLLAWDQDCPVPAAPLRAIAECDSVAVDPHKHGLQPYGCGCILFRNPSVRDLLLHPDSGYAFLGLESDAPGRLGLECSRAGAAACALWLTLQCLPLKSDQGLGSILRACLRATRRWATLLKQSGQFQPLLPPELDILVFFPGEAVDRVSALDRACRDIQQTLAAHPKSLHLGLLSMPSQMIIRHCPGIEADRPDVHILRAVLMKPEHEHTVDGFHHRLTAALTSVQSDSCPAGSGFPQGGLS